MHKSTNWKQKLAGSLSKLPDDRPRPVGVETYLGNSRGMMLPKSLSIALTELSQRCGVTLFMTLLAAFELLLYRYFGQEDILTSFAAAARDKVETEQLIGFFSNNKLEPSLTFRQLADRVRQECVEAYNHQDIPLEKLVEELKLEQDRDRSPLFQTKFILHLPWSDGRALTTLELPDLKIAPQCGYVDRGQTKYDLTLVMREQDLGLRMVFDYNADLFDVATIDRMLGHMQTLLEGIVADPDCSIAQLPLLTAPEQQQLLEWNHTQTEYPQDKCIHQLFEEQVERTPDAVAVVFEDQQFTYRELNNRANQLANYLKKLGVAPDVPVGICLERSLEMVVGLLGILKAGGAYVPLDPAYPQERLAYMLENSGVKLLLAIQQLVTELSNHDIQVVCLDTDWDRIVGGASVQQNRENSSNLVSEVRLENLGYIIYTSGSTGQPKGVAMTQRALCNLILWQISDPTVTVGGASPVENRAKTLQFAPISFDVSFQEMFSTWCAGGTLVLIADKLRRDPFALLELLEQQAIERLFLPFVALQQLAEVAVSNQSFPQQLREVITAGEQLQITPAISKFFSNLSNCTLHNHYGPSESHVVTTFSLTTPVENWSALPPIGRPIANTQIYVLDSQMQPLPIGVSGEMYIGGDCLARGYFNRPDLTAERFIPNPFSNDPNARLYKTGDLARYLPDGNIEYLGRIDNQVKIRGYRIELGEIETLLGQHPAIVQTIVVVREDRPRDKRLVAYCVVNPAAPPQIINELRDFLAQQLPNYMVPALFVLLDSLPLTPSGKIDRRALPAPDLSSLLATETFVAARTHQEQQLAEIWMEVLGLERVSIHDNFFLLGGHSLLATQVISRIRKNLKLELPLRQLFEAPTVADLAIVIDKDQHQESELSEDRTIPHRANRENAPLSFAQQRLWFLNQLEPDSPFYNFSWAVRLQGDLNLDILQQALDAIVVHQEILRTKYITDNGNPIQVIAAPQSVELSSFDLQQYEVVERETQVQKILHQESHRSINLESESMFRGCLLQIAPQQQILLLVMHHIASDGWSIDVFWEQLTQLYTAFLSGRPNPLATLPIQYADYAVWQREWLTGEVLANQLHYWQQQLAGANPLLELPTDRPRPPVQTYRGASQSIALPATLTTALKQLCAQEGVTLYMTLLAAFQTLLYRYSRQEDIIVGSPIAGRNRAEIERLIGFFVNTLVLRTDLSGNPSFQELLTRVRSTTLDAYAHQDLPFEKLVEELNPERSLSYSPLFQVMFVLQNTLEQTVELPGLTQTPVEIGTATAQFDLTLSVAEQDGLLIGSWNYNTDLFDAGTIERMNTHFQILLAGIVANPAQPISQLPLLSEPEQHQLLVEWNNTQTEYPQDKCIHQLFEAQVEQTPDAVAVVFGEQQLTYRELNERAERLAAYLQAQGVGADVLVGIYLERCVEMVVALLGILKAGGAYVPLDPAYPAERLTFMLADTQLQILLTTARLAPKLPSHTATVVCLDTDWTQIECAAVTTSAVVAAGNLAYVIYTSGSTGQPKGVSVVHRGVVRLVCDTNYVSITATDVFLQLASISFDAATFEIWGCLINGGKLVVAPPHQLTLSELAALIQTQQVTILWLTAGLFHLMVERQIDAFKPLRQLLAGGDVLSVPHVQKLLAAVPDCQLINGYGPTENTTFTCCERITAPLQSGSIPIGKPIANTQVYILDPDLQLVPIGVAGELYAGGDGLAREYFNRPDLTAERFIANPVSNNPRERLYKTGDLARYLPDGKIEYLGRLDNQVKIRGFRVELGEVESLLAQHPAVAQAVVVVREDNPGDKRLVAYYVASNNPAPPPAELRDWLARQAPSYMVPDAFVLLPDLPMTNNGKVDRHALPIPEPSSLTSTDTFTAPRTELETQLTEIWQQVLGVKAIGINDNFFALGGNSLIAVRLFAEIEQFWGNRLPLATLLQAQTIASLAEVLSQTAWMAPWSSLVAIQPHGTKSPLFVVHSAGGNIVEYYPLARYLGSDQPVYGIQSVGLDGKQEPLTSVEAMASHYIREIQTIQPQGPYYLAGYSMGGSIGYEIAQQLLAQGEQVALLALLDTNSPNLVKIRPSWSQAIQIHVRNLQQLEFSKQLKYIWERIEYRIGYVTSKNDERERLIKGLSKIRTITPEYIKILDNNLQANQNYVSRPYLGKITLFRSQIQDRKVALNPDLGWNNLPTEGIEIYNIPGDHFNLLKEPCVRVVAERLQYCLQQARLEK